MPRVCTALALVLAVASPAAAQAQDFGRDDVEGIVRELLQREPELVIDAIQRFQQREEAARAAAAQEAIGQRMAAMHSPEHPSIGPADAAVTVVEFFDYRCGFCRRVLPSIAALAEANDDLRVVFIDFPVLGPDSLRAAQASVAAWMQKPEIYMAFHEALMTANDLTAPGIEALADAHDLDTDRLFADMQGDAVRSRLEANFAIAQEIGVEGTPAFVIGDRLVAGAVPLSQLESAVADARDET